MKVKNKWNMQCTYNIQTYKNILLKYILEFRQRNEIKQLKKMKEKQFDDDGLVVLFCSTVKNQKNKCKY